MQLHRCVQATLSAIRNLEVVRYAGATIVLYNIIWRIQLVYIDHCPLRLYSRSPLLGVSVNGVSECTVHILHRGQNTLITTQLYIALVAYNYNFL